MHPSNPFTVCIIWHKVKVKETHSDQLFNQNSGVGIHDFMPFPGAKGNAIRLI